MKQVKVLVESISPCGSGNYKSYVNVGTHVDAIQVTGRNLTECIFRTQVVVDAFKRVK